MASGTTGALAPIADIAAARRRSAVAGVDPSTREIPYVGVPPPAATEMTKSSVGVLDTLVVQLEDSDLGVVLADRDGRLVRCDAGSRATRRAMDDRSIDIGFSLAESDVGTNGVGTSLVTRSPAVIVGRDHHLECFQAFACVNAPIIDPISGRTEGSVGVLCPADRTEPLLLPTARQLSWQIGEQLLESSAPEERQLLDRFLRDRRPNARAFATVGAGITIATPAARRILADLDHRELWDRLSSSTRPGCADVVDVELTDAAGVAHRLRCRPVFRSGELGGATVEFVAPSVRALTRRTGRRADDRLGELVGSSSAWRTVVRDAHEVARLALPVLVVGERGTGRSSVAAAIGDLAGARPLHVADSGSVLIDGAQEWLRGVSVALGSEVTVLLRRIDQLEDPVAAALASLVTRGDVRARLIATTERSTAIEPGLAALLDRLDVLRIDIPPLRERRDDIAPLARHLAARWGCDRIDAPVMTLLNRQSWPGNVTELSRTLRSAAAIASPHQIRVHHLPSQLSQSRPAVPLHGLRQREADAIVAAVHSTATRAEAAEMLGISRATLYRRIHSYGLDLD